MRENPKLSFALSSNGRRSGSPPLLGPCGDQRQTHIQPLQCSSIDGQRSSHENARHFSAPQLSIRAVFKGTYTSSQTHQACDAHSDTSSLRTHPRLSHQEPSPKPLPSLGSHPGQVSHWQHHGILVHPKAVQPSRLQDPQQQFQDVIEHQP